MLHLFFLLFVYCNGNPLPYFNKCHISDDDCVTSSTRNAVRHLASGDVENNISSMDPLNIDELNITTPNLMLIFNDIVIMGIKNCNIKYLRASENKISIKTICNIEAKSKYNINGKLLSLPIKDIGTVHLSLKHITVDANVSMLIVTGKDGKLHWKPNTVDHKYKLMDAAIIMDSSVQSNNLINQAVQKMLKDNPKNVVAEIAPSVIKKMVVIFLEQLKHFFHHQPLSNLFTNAEFQ